MKWKKLFHFVLIFGLFSSVMLSVCTSEQELQNNALVSEAIAQSYSQQDEIFNSRQNAITRAVAKVSPAVVSINVTRYENYRVSPFLTDPFWRHFFKYDNVMREVNGLGSGFIFTPKGHILTNQHVIEGAENIVVTLPGGEKYDATVVGEDYTTDVAILKMEGDNLPHIPLGNSDDIIIGEWSIAIGNPFGLFDVSAKPTVTVGVISALDQDFGRIETDRIYDDMIQTDAAINSGNSGGPLVNSTGEVIGINTFIYSGNDGIGTNIGLGFAIPINRVKSVLDDLMKHGSVKRNVWMSIQYRNISPTVAFYLGLRSTDGVIVTDVERKSPWEQAGLEAEDIILEVEGESIRSVADIERIKEKLNLDKGDSIELKVYRNRRIYRAIVKI